MPAPDLRRLKLTSEQLTNDMQHFLRMHQSHTAPIPVPFHANMGGATAAVFCNTFPAFTDTNDLSLAVFIKFGAFKMLFPADLETAGWEALLAKPEFRNELIGTTILVASHHGRRSGYSDKVFQYVSPMAVVISDKSIIHETQRID
jgi:beta-lactamase superfamily II metal-dependent hydrolase